MKFELGSLYIRRLNLTNFGITDGGLVPNPKKSVNSFGGIPDQVLVDVSHAYRMSGGGPSAVGFLVITVIFAVVMSILAIYGVVPVLWDTFAFPWTSVAILSVGIWADSYETKYKFMCNYCANRRCGDRGVDRKVFFCNKWAAPLVPHFILILLAVYGIFTTLLIFLSSQFWIMILSMFLSAIFLGISLLGLIAELSVKSKRDHLVFIKPPIHSPNCVCKGTGICPQCHGTGQVKILNDTIPCTIVCPEEPGVEEKGIEGAGCILCSVILIILVIYFGIWSSGVLF